jgi:hypothetical protein
MPTSRCALLGRIAAGSLLTAGGPAAATPEQQVAKGEYLTTIMDRATCHTDGALVGRPDHARHLAGSTSGHEVPGLGIFYPPNLTPDPDTGLGRWNEEDIVLAIRGGVRPDGRELAPAMPWRSYAALTDEDARAMATYLKSIPAVRFAPPAVVQPGERAPAPYLSLVVPP